MDVHGSLAMKWERRLFHHREADSLRDFAQPLTQAHRPVSGVQNARAGPRRTWSREQPRVSKFPSSTKLNSTFHHDQGAAVIDPRSYRSSPSRWLPFPPCTRRPRVLEEPSTANQGVVDGAGIVFCVRVMRGASGYLFVILHFLVGDIGRGDVQVRY